MRVCLQMLYTKSWEELAVITMPNIVKYCRKHDYTWNIQCIDEPYDAFEKIRQIQKVFETNEEDVVWSLDCDTLITNYAIKVESFLDDEHDLFLTSDYNNINCGSFSIKKTGWSEWLLKTLLSLEGLPKIHCEQDALIWFIKHHSSQMVAKIKLLEHPSINSYLYENYPEISKQTHEQGQWQQGDFILHLPGIGMDKRIEILNETKQHIVYE